MPERPTLSRRSLLVGGASAAAGLAFAGPRMAAASPTPSAGGRPIRDAFTLGVASGDPTPHSVVLWTRLAPDPLTPGGGMPSRQVPVAWEVSTDDRFRRCTQRGTASATPDGAHAVHVTVAGLEPGRPYWYRFRVGRELSPVGRTRTAPAPSASLQRLRLALVSCNDWQDGYYTAYRSIADDDVDLVVHVGDYIYENSPSDETPRKHDGTGEPVDLTTYRSRHALYKTDPDLQAAHAAAPFVVVFDDHEVDNDWSGDNPQDPDEQPTDVFLARRAAAFQAFYEHLPMPRSAQPNGSSIAIYRSLDFAGLARINLLDTRQFRSLTEPCGYGTGPACDAVFDPSRTMLGEAQEAWLTSSLDQSQARWNLIAQQVPFMRIDVGTDVQELKLDKWDAYPVARQRLLDFLAARQPSNPVVLTGDLHDSWAGDLPANFDDPAAASVGSELICPSITSDGDGSETSEDGDLAMANGRNPHIRFHSNRRGYTLVDITPSELTATFRTLDYVSTPGSPIHDKARFVIEHGQHGLQSA